MFTHALGIILLAALLCWIAHLLFPASVPRPLLYIGIAIFILGTGGYLDRATLFH